MRHHLNLRQRVSWVRPLMLGIPLACAIAACGGGGGGTVTSAEGNGNNGNESSVPADPLSKYKTQALNWHACGDSAWQAVAKLQCADFKVPLDYAAPEKGEISISAMRVPAMSAQRKGAIFFNPGGPGGDGLMNGFNYLNQILRNNGASQQVNTLQAQLLNGYDLLGFTPRGTSNDALLICSSDADQLTVDFASTARNLPGNFEAMSANQQSNAQACQAQPLTPYISTDATARDMDLLRHLMGDSKISYLGYSYGTWLGAWYGRLFPERVDRMVLDSNSDVSAEHMDFNEYQAIARDTIINEYLAPKAARFSPAYALGSTPDEVRTNLAALDPWMKKATTDFIETRNNSGTGNSLIALTAAIGLNKLISPPSNIPDALVANAIESHQFVPYGSPISNYIVGQKAQKIWGDYQYYKSLASLIGKPDKKTQLAASGGVNGAVFYSVLCNDSAPPSFDLSYWKAMGDSIAQKAPFFGGENPANQTCMYWRNQNIQHPPLSALQGLDILMVQSQYDSATPTPGAMKGFAALPKAHMLYVTDEYQHGVFPYNTACVDVPVLQYLLGQSPNWRQMNCAPSGAGLPFVAGIASKSAGQASNSSESTEAQQRSDLIDEFKKSIGFHTVN